METATGLLYRNFTASSLGSDVKRRDYLGEQERKSVDRWDFLCYIGISWYSNTIQVKNVLFLRLWRKREPKPQEP